MSDLWKRSVLLLLALGAWGAPGTPRAGSRPDAAVDAAEESFADPEPGGDAGEEPEEDPEEDPADLEEAASYEEGRGALDEGDYAEALRLFSQTARLNGSRADAALYWKAYAHYRLGQRGESLTTLEGLRKAYAQSRWLDDARALELEIRGSSGQPVSPEDEDKEDLKLMALNALMNMEPERALPMLEKFISSGSSPRLKEQALFVLTQTGAPRAREVVIGIARGRSNPDLQRKAIECLGLMGGRANTPVLEEIYRATDDRSVRRAVLNAFMISSDTEPLLAIARDPRDPEMRREAISLLGAQGAAGPLLDLYRKETSVETREGILQALGTSGSAEALLEVIRAEKQPRLRAAAARGLGLTSAAASGPALASLYDTEKERDVRRAILEALMLQNNPKALIAIARKEKDPDMKRAAVEKLSVMQSKEAIDYMLELLED